MGGILHHRYEKTLLGIFLPQIIRNMYFKRCYYMAKNKGHIKLHWRKLGPVVSFSDITPQPQVISENCFWREYFMLNTLNFM